MNKKIKYLYVFIALLVILWCGGIIIAPLLEYLGYKSSSLVLYEFYSKVCHQNTNSSFLIEGGKFGVCIRCTAVYFGFLIALLMMPFFGILKKFKNSNSEIFILSSLPMFADVVLNYFSIHKSTVETRLITGIIFGCSVSWFVVPILIEACLQLIKNRTIKRIRRIQDVRKG